VLTYFSFSTLKRSIVRIKTVILLIKFLLEELNVHHPMKTLARLKIVEIRSEIVLFVSLILA